MFVYNSYTAISRGNTNPRTGSFTCASGVTLLIVSICTSGLTDRTGGAPTYNSVALTQAGSNQKLASTGETVSELWYMLNPPTGSSYTVSVPNAGSLYLTIGITSFSSPPGSTATFVSATGNTGTSLTAYSNSISGTPDGLAVGFCSSGTGYMTSATVNYTSVYLVSDTTYGSGLQYGPLGTDSITFSWTFLVYSEDYAICCGIFSYDMPDRITTSTLTSYSVIRPPEAISVITLNVYSTIKPPDGVNVSSAVVYSVSGIYPIEVSKLISYTVLNIPGQINISKLISYTVTANFPSVAKANLYSIIFPPGVVNISKAIVYSIVGPQLEVEIELSDSFAFNDRFAITEELSLTDSFAFNDQISFVHSLDITDSFVFDESITVDIFKDIQITDSFAFDDSFTIDYTDLLLTFYEEFAFNDYFEFYDYLYFVDNFVFNDSIVTVNENIRFTFTDSFTFDDSTSNIFAITHYLITWRCRTRTPQWGYGGSQYGSLVSYGDGSADDIESFVVDIGYLDTSNVFHRTIPAQITINIEDSENPDANAYYLYSLSPTFVFINNNLTFRVWQKDINGVLSPCREVQCFPLFLSS